jgi:quinohemoprotein ethanol dehydrogenase
METAALWEVTTGPSTVLIGGGHLHIDQGIGRDTRVDSKISGKLIAWDPRTQKARWHQDLELPINGGVLSTAGNLVFQATATGDVFAYQADTGKRVWSMYTGSAAQAAPTTVMVDGEQLILFPIGAGGAMSNWAQFASNEKSRGPSRLLAFKLGGTVELPPYRHSEIFPRPPRPRPDAKLARKGAGLFEDKGCVACHGEAAIRDTGHVPDLRKASAEVHDTFAAIVLGGRAAKGMPSFAGAASADDLAALQAFVLYQAWNAYDAQEAIKAKPRADAASAADTANSTVPARSPAGKTPLLLNGQMQSTKGFTPLPPWPTSMVKWGDEHHALRTVYSGEFTVDLYEASDGEVEVVDQPYDEFVHVLHGFCTLTPQGGKPQTYQVGDVFVVPKGFTGTWEGRQGFRELIVIETSAYKRAVAAIFPDAKK